MDAVTRHSWFLGSSSWNLLKGASNKPITRIAFEVLLIVLFFAFTVKTESLISFYIVQPLFKRFFGDNEQLRRELEQQEGELRNLFNRGPPTSQPQTSAPRQEQSQGNARKRKEPIIVD